MTDLRFAATRTIAYFSMEVGLDPGLPTYSGGLGVLAGDTLRSAADLALPVVGVTLAHRRGYFRQHLDGMSATPAEMTSRRYSMQRVANFMRGCF